MTELSTMADAIGADLVACRECDRLHRRVRLAPGEAARCGHCGSVLYRHPRFQTEHLIALTLTALITLAIANCFPIVALQVNGIPSSTTLFGSVVSLWSEGRWTVALLVVATALVFPLLDVLSLLGLLLADRSGPLARWRAPLSRLVRALRPWGMTEVFLLGVIVSVVKLSHMARVMPGPALGAFAASAVLLAVISSFDLRSLWSERT